MEASDRAIARIIFKNKVHESNGQKYEDLFCAIQTYHNNNFTSVKPQGRLGDRKNDGFDRSAGVYYQVYAPEEPESKISEAIKKLAEDFNGLKAYWDSLHKIQEYHFVFNDKFSGSKPTLEEELSKIATTHSLTKAVPFLNKDLEFILFNLEDDKIHTVLGHIPSSNNKSIIQISWLVEVANYLTEKWNNSFHQSKLIAPDFEKKIEFNNLTTKVASLLHTFNYQSGVIEKYFETSGAKSRELLQNIFTEFYKKSLETFKEYNGDDKADLIFFEILKKASPDNCTKAQQDTVLALMSYYFESCDIFEEPTKEKT